jgi:Zn-dependent protease
MELTGAWQRGEDGGPPGWPSPSAPEPEPWPALPSGGPRDPAAAASPWWPGAAPAPGAGTTSDVRYGAGAPASPGPAGAAAGDRARQGLARPGATAGPARSASRLRRAWRRAASIVVAAGAFVLKFGALLLKIKYLGLVVSMLLSVVAYSLFFGWTFAAGFVLLILVHEMGHVLELRRQGVRASLPLFVPFLGAFVNMREMPRSAYHEALSGLAGPAFGTMASVVVAFWGRATGSQFLLQLAAVGFLINLFNLMPVLPLDGGRAAAALHPVLWLVGLVGLLVFAFFVHSPVVLIVLVLGGFELYRRWTRRNSPASIAYHSLRPQQRLAIASLYVLVVAVTLTGYQLTYVARSL